MIDINSIVTIIKNNCCLFVGAGIPNAIELPLWKEFANHLINFVWKKRHEIKINTISQSMKEELESNVNKGNLVSVITYCFELFIGKEKEIIDEVIKVFNDNNKISKANTNAVYNELIKIFSNSMIVQTNLDKSIESISKYPSFINNSLPNYVQTMPRPCVIYLHGVITEPNSWILTRDQYISYYQRNSRFTSFIQQLFLNNDVLFLGYSLSDKELLDQIAMIKGNGRKYIVVFEDKDREKYSNAIFENEIKHYGICVYRYNIEQNGYEEFINFLRDLNSKLRPVTTYKENDQARNITD